MRFRGWVALLLLAPVAILVLVLQLAVLLGVVGAAQTAWGAKQRDSGTLHLGISTLQRAAGVLDAAFALPTTTLLELNPLTLGVVDDLAATAHAVSVSSQALTPLGDAAVAVLGFDGQQPMISGSTIDPARVADLSTPVEELDDDLRGLSAALAEIPGDGPLGRPIGALRDSLSKQVSAVNQVTAAAATAIPALPDALGADGPRRYLICALNDAEVFASGGAPLSAMLVEADRGTIQVTISGQLESKLSPNNPSIVWEHAGGPPWYRDSRRYPFVNSNFHPDFRTASTDMRRAWAALGFPEAQGVITVDIGALSSVLAWTGPVTASGFGEVDAASLVRVVLVDSYRQFNTADGVLQRHARNEALTHAVAQHVSSPLNLLTALRGALDAIPPRHIQASFDDPSLQAAIEQLGAAGELQSGAGDLIGVWSQSGPNKLSVFQRRSISQEVQLTADGGAEVRRTISFHNDVPEGLDGDPTTYRGYLALLARMRVAYRVPTNATDFSISTGTSTALVPEGRTGPFPDERGGGVLWQGHMTPQGEVTTVEMHYTLPAGSFPSGGYEVRADPQALTIVPTLQLRVIPAPDTELPNTPGWSRSGADLVWDGSLDRSLHLRIG